MSTTTRQQHGPIYRSDVVIIITRRASKFIKTAGEKNDNVRRLAQSVVNQFYHIADPNLRMTFTQRLGTARDMATEQLAELFKGITLKEIDDGMHMGSKALELSSKVQEHESSVSKATVIMRRDADLRKKKEASEHRSKAPARAGRLANRVDKPSPKQRYIRRKMQNRKAA